MTEQRILSEREAGFEAKFAQEEEASFRAIARRDRLFGEWAIAHGQLDEVAGAELQHEILSLHGGPDHDNEVIDLIAVALAGAGLTVDRAAVAKQLVHFAQAASQAP